MRNELFTIGPLTVYGYGFMIAVGVIAAWIITNRRAEKQKLDHEHVFSLVIWCLLGGMFCAKILFWITEWKSIVQDPHYILDTISDGFVVYGGIIGGILAGCCYGRETNSIFSITFQNSDFAPNHVALIPTQIYSSVLDFLHFGILLYIARHKKKDGQVAACYLIFYSIGRFVLEFFRGDLIRGSVGILSTSQFISLFILVAGILILVIRSKKKTATDL